MCVYIYIYIYESGQKSSLVEKPIWWCKIAVDDFFTNEIQALQRCWPARITMLKNKLHLVTFHKNIFIGRLTFLPTLISITFSLSLPLSLSLYIYIYIYICVFKCIAFSFRCRFLFQLLPSVRSFSSSFFFFHFPVLFTSSTPAANFPTHQKTCKYICR